MEFRKMILYPVLCVILISCSQNNSNQTKPTGNQNNGSKNVPAKNISTTPTEDQTEDPFQPPLPPPTESEMINKLVNKYQGQIPKEWGENVTGVYTALNTQEKVIALTFDACGGPKGSDYDEELISYLKKMSIPATLFINYRWIDANNETFMELSKLPLFEIENHGYLHKPLSVNGKAAWGITGTEGISAIVDEVLMNHRKIQSLTGKEPKYFRSGTAYYDDVAVKVVDEIGEKPVNFNVLGDAGATFSKEQVKKALLSAKPGAVVIMHMNQPKGETAEGVMAAIPELINQGFRFVKLSDFPLK
jgi:peptidoglycan/xylan/chitin deacetylase (PgdA/CDA1 family)